MEEIELEGGRSTRGVTRSGDILYRPHKPQSDFANSFLKFLEERTCPFSQRYIGRDKYGRDMFRFIEGYVPKEIGDTTLPQLRTFMRIMRIITRSFRRLRPQRQSRVPQRSFSMQYRIRKR